MLLKMYSAFRNDIAKFREYAERGVPGTDLGVDRRLDVARSYGLTDDEIAIVLREDNKAGIDLIAKQIYAATDAAGLGEAFKITALQDYRQDLDTIVEAVKKNIEDWVKYLNDNSFWPGPAGPFAERVAPAVVEPMKHGAPHVLTIHGWLFDPDTFKAFFYPAGSAKADDVIVAKLIAVASDGPYRSIATVSAVLLQGTYDVRIQQKDPASPYPEGSSRLAAAVSVVEEFSINVPP